jgi:hypothetical protein
MLRAGKNAAWAMQIMWARSIEKVPITTIYDLPLIGETFQYVSQEAVGAYLTKETASVAKKQRHIPNGSVLHLAELGYLH